MAIKNALTIKATIPPANVALHTQYVVIALKIKKDKKEYQNICFPLADSSSNTSKGINAINNTGKNPISGQENANNKPLNSAKNKFLIRVTNIIIFLLI